MCYQALQRQARGKHIIPSGTKAYMTTTSERKTHSIARKTHAAHSASTPTRASSSFTIRFGRARTMHAKLMEAFL